MDESEIYDIGDRPGFVGTFTEYRNGPFVDPALVVVIVRNPAGTETLYANSTHPETFENPEVGTWVFTLPGPLDAAGEWTVRMRGVEGVETAAEITIRVRRSKFDAPLAIS